jgi:DNA invertase Pin-like site-specific DNA recombinase
LQDILISLTIALKTILLTYSTNEKMNCRKTKVVPYETIEKMKEARNNGKSVKYIMASFHVSESTVIRHTKKKSWKIKTK